MTADVISHTSAPRKRAPARGWSARRITAVLLTLAALAAIAWVSPYLHPVSTKIANQPLPASQPPAMAAPAPQLPHPIAAEAQQPVPRARAPQRRTGVPLDAQAATPGEDYEVLSASELDAISQARDE